MSKRPRSNRGFTWKHVVLSIAGMWFLLAILNTLMLIKII